MKLFSFIGIVSISLLLSSCEFNCSIGKKEEVETPKTWNNRVRNDIKLETNNVKLEKAYLVFNDGSNIPEDNIVDFSKEIKMIVVVDSGWKELNGKVNLGASEKITVLGKVLLDEKDIFAKDLSSTGISPEDAKIIGLTASIELKSEVRPLTTFLVSFNIWDKNSEAFVKGSYKLYSK
jgi:hypothetical protein